MNKLKTGLAAVLASAALSGCGVNTSGNIDINTNDIQYKQDSRTGLCFAFAASRKAMEASTTGLGLTEVPCTDEVLSLTQ